VRAPIAIPPADVFTKRQFRKDNYEICEKTARGGGKGGRESADCLLLFVRRSLIAIKFAVYRRPLAPLAPLTDDASRGARCTGP